MEKTLQTLRILIVQANPSVIVPGYHPKANLEINMDFTNLWIIRMGNRKKKIKKMYLKSKNRISYIVLEEMNLIIAKKEDNLIGTSMITALTSTITKIRINTRKDNIMDIIISIIILQRNNIIGSQIFIEIEIILQINMINLLTKEDGIVKNPNLIG